MRGQVWRLVATHAFERCALITLLGLDRDNLGDTLQVLEPFDRVVRPASRSRWRISGRRAVAERIADAIVSAQPWRSCWTAASADLDLLPWQLEPALAVLGGATRVLLADGVGRGKTIQAGLILSELSARGLIGRALILTPVGLRWQWADELSGRFGLHVSVLDQSALARDATHLPPGANPWAAARIVISSIDLLKRPETLAGVDGVPFDLLIVDEAHHVTPDSDRGALVARLAARTPWIVLVSATPHSGNQRAFQFLQDAGGTATDRLVIFRRCDPRAGPIARRRFVTLLPSTAERTLIDGVQRYAHAIWRGLGTSSHAARLVATILARRAASSPEAALASLLRRRALLVEDDRPRPQEQAALPWEEHDACDGLEADRLLSTPGLADGGEEQRQLEMLSAAASAARATATKAGWLERFVVRAGEPVVVFSEFRDTVEALRARLAPRLPVAVLHGGLSPAIRQTATTSFVTGQRQLLLTTDAGGEGLNLQARCRTVVNIELPWNPLRLEQRVGRVDRLGQTRRVHAVHLLYGGSIEEAVRVQLERRAASIEAQLPSAGDSTDIDMRVAAAVLGDAPVDTTVPACASDQAPGAAEEAVRLCRLRALSHPESRLGLEVRSGSPQHRRRLRAPPDTCVSLPRRRSGPLRSARGLFAVTTNLAAAPGGVSLLMPMSIALSAPFPTSPAERLRAWQAVIDHVGTTPAVRAAVAMLVDHEQSARQAFAHAVRARVRELRAVIDGRREPLFQPALFDGRAARQAIEQATAQEAHRAHLAEVEARLPEADTLILEPLRMIAAWLEG